MRASELSGSHEPKELVQHACIVPLLPGAVQVGESIIIKAIRSFPTGSAPTLCGDHLRKPYSVHLQDVPPLYFSPSLGSSTFSVLVLFPIRPLSIDGVEHPFHVFVYNNYTCMYV